MKVLVLLSLLTLGARACDLGALDPDSATARFTSLLTRLVVDTRRLPVDAAKEIAASDRPLNPFARDGWGLRETEAHGLRKGFAKLVGDPALDWARVREIASRIARGESEATAKREQASDGTKALANLKVLNKALFPLVDAETHLDLEVGANGDAYVLHSVRGAPPRILRIRAGGSEEVPLPEGVWNPRMVRADDGSVYVHVLTREGVFSVVELASGMTVKRIDPATAPEAVAELRSRRGRDTALPSIRTSPDGHKRLEILYVPFFTQSAPPTVLTIPLGPGASGVAPLSIPQGTVARKADGSGYYIASAVIENGTSKLVVWDTAERRRIFETPFPRSGDTPPPLYLREGIAGNPVLVSIVRGGAYHRFDIGKGTHSEWDSDFAGSQTALVDGPGGDPVLARTTSAVRPTEQPAIHLMGKSGPLSVESSHFDRIFSFHTDDGRSFLVSRAVDKPHELMITDIASGEARRLPSPTGMVRKVARLPDGRVVALTFDDRVGTSLVQLYGP